LNYWGEAIAVVDNSDQEIKQLALEATIKERGPCPTDPTKSAFYAFGAGISITIILHVLMTVSNGLEWKLLIATLILSAVVYFAQSHNYSSWIKCNMKHWQYFYNQNTGEAE
jgi:hypothetical protein